MILSNQKRFARFIGDFRLIYTLFFGSFLWVCFKNVIFFDFFCIFLLKIVLFRLYLVL